MADALVFHLAERYAGGLRVREVLRFGFDPSCYDPRYTVETGDLWDATSTEGEVTNYRVSDVRTFMGTRGEECHSFMTPLTTEVAIK